MSPHNEQCNLKKARGRRNRRRRLAKKMISYSVAAGAAALGVAGDAADAGIVYSGNLGPGGMGIEVEVDADGFYLDVNGMTHDTNAFSGADLKLFQNGSGNSSNGLQFYGIGYLAGAAVTSSGTYVSNLADGTPINRNDRMFRNQNTSSGSSYSYPSPYPILARQTSSASNAYGPFAGETGIVGFVFDISGNEHFGWLRLQVENFFAPAGGTAFTILDYAYEDIAGKSIEAAAVPEPASLGLLALGAAGLMMFRRRKANR